MNRKLTKKQAERNRKLGKALAKWERDFPRLCRDRKLTKAQGKSVYEANQKLLRLDAELEDFRARNRVIRRLQRKTGTRLCRLLAKHVAALWRMHDNERVLTIADSVKMRDSIAGIIAEQAIRLDKEFFVTLGKCLDEKCTGDSN